jgi:hypothetical protein
MCFAEEPLRMKNRRILIAPNDMTSCVTDDTGSDSGRWSASWVSIDPIPLEPFIVAYRCRFELDATTTFRLHLSADERYELYLDGTLIGRGPDRGDALNWYYQSYELSMDAGSHVLVALVQKLGAMAPRAQISVAPGLIVTTQNLDAALLDTGLAPWEACVLTGFDLATSPITFGVGAYIHMYASQMRWGIVRGETDGWSAVAIGQRGTSIHAMGNWGEFDPPLLRPSRLPAMMNIPRHVGQVRYIDTALANSIATVHLKKDLINEHTVWSSLLQDKGTVTIPPHTQRRVLIDLETYYCAYPVLQVSDGSGSVVDWQWAESLRYEEKDIWDPKNPKGNRNEIDNKHFDGVGDIFEPDGQVGRVFQPHWWRAGRYIQLCVTTADQALVIEKLYICETRYPLKDQSEFDCSDQRYKAVWPIMVRTMQMCSHEHYMDCPYYEQLMYIGDSRLEVLTTYCMTTDDRLPRSSIDTFASSIMPDGLTQSRYPSSVRQVIPPFSLWWVGMVYDHALWRGNMDFIRQMLPGVRRVLDAYALKINAKGLVEPLKGWNYVDWVDGWNRGTPPHANSQPTATITLQFVIALQQAAELEQWLGEPEMAQRWTRLSHQVFEVAMSVFMDDQRGLIAETLDHQVFGEHAQCLALLTGMLNQAASQQLFEAWHQATDLARCSIYFSHYLFEMLRSRGRIDLLLERMQLWYDLPAKGCRTTIESPEPSRSDCHAWGAHPIYHAMASILGIRPGSMGFDTVRIEPCLGSLDHAQGVLPHLLGDIVVRLHTSDTGLEGTIELPTGLTGEYVHNGYKIQLLSGKTQILPPQL